MTTALKHAQTQVLTTALKLANTAAIKQALRRAMRAVVPPPMLLPSEYAEKHIVIGAGNAIPGPIRFDNAPYQRQMLDAALEPGVYRIDLMCGAQTGKTTVLQCLMAYYADYDPRSQIFLMPSQGDVQTFQETKLRPMLGANKSLAAKMAKPRGREGVNNQRMISYPGGWIMFAWAGSPKTLRSRSAPLTLADEVDGMERTAEGDPVELLDQRSATFGDQRLSVRSSTPTIKRYSRIETGFYAGDQRRYYVPCPHCGHQQHLKWENVVWHTRHSSGIKDAQLDAEIEHDIESSRYLCEANGCLWSDGERIAAIRNAIKNGGGFRASKPFTGHISFHAPEMLSTFRKLSDIVRSYLQKLAIDDLQSFVNVSLAEAYEPVGEQADPDSLQAHQIAYEAELPAGVLFLTAGIDMQVDRLEIEIVGWGAGERSWSIDYRVLWGDPLLQDVWDDLDDLLARIYQHARGHQLRVQAAALDTGGTSGYTNAAYEWVRGQRGRRVFAVKGVGGFGRQIVDKPTRKRSGKNSRKVDLWSVGVDEAKLVVMRRLENHHPNTPGYCAFPEDRLLLLPDYFDQLTAENLRVRFNKGQPIREWHKPPKARNEALDCRVYAYAALKIVNPSLKQLALRAGVSDEPTVETAAPEPTPQATKSMRIKLPVKSKPADAANPQPKPPVAANPQPKPPVAANPPLGATPAKPESSPSKAHKKSRENWVKNW